MPKITVEAPRDVHEELKLIAKEEGITLHSLVLRQLIELTDRGF